MKKTVILLFTLCVTLLPNAHAFDADQIQIRGFISQGYLVSSDHDFWYTPTEDGTFQFNETKIHVMAEPLDNLRLGIQLLSRDMGEVGNNEVAVDWAYGDYSFRNWLGIRAGLLKRPFGLYDQSRHVDAARTEIFLPTGVYPDIARELFFSTRGVGIYGILPGNLSYELQYGVAPLDTDGGAVKMADGMLGSKTENIENDYVIAFMLRWDTPLSGLMFSFSGFSMGDIVQEADIGKINTSTFELYISSLEYEFENFTFSSEYRHESVETSLNGNMSLMDQILEAYHITGSYRFTDWFELGLGYSERYTDQDDKDGDRFKKIGQPAAKAWCKDLTMITRFDINDYWIFKLEGHYMNGLEGVTSELGDDPSEDWFLFAAKMTFSF
ncbi:hypothetical protein QUF72_15885 [Desulfobacterales bacterium HSG2]|nr:hypothetical protein [Desulfobacterales bacterium HSG2]